MINLTLIIIAYLAALATIYWHELGHFGKKIRITYFPLPVGASMQAKFRYGGLIANFAALYLIYKYQPQNIFLQLFGLFNFIHFVLYTIFGSINREIDESKVPANMYKYIVFDDIPNRLWYIFVPIGIYVFIKFKSYYIPLLVSTIQAI